MRATVCDGHRLVAALTAAGAALDGSRAEIDALNVFPVPDGDTGTNMALTWHAACDAAAATLEAGEERAGALVQSAAEGALLHARGSSGLILSQILAGAAAAVGDSRDLSVCDFVAALHEAAKTARAALRHPVEGTILSVASAAASAAAEQWQRGVSAGDEPSWPALLAATAAAARAALARTPAQLAVLAEAGRVDAGGRGFVALLDGLLDFVRAGGYVAPAGAAEYAAPPRIRDDGAIVTAGSTSGETYAYCTQFLIRNPARALERMRNEAGALGDHAHVVGTARVVRVHVHTNDPGAALSWAARLGRLDDVRVEDMQEQADQAHPPPAPPEPAAAGRAARPEPPADYFMPGGTPGASGDSLLIYRGQRATPVDDVYVCVLVAGSGFARICADLGADAVSCTTVSARDREHAATSEATSHAAGLVERPRSAADRPYRAALWLVCADTGMLAADVSRLLDGLQAPGSARGAEDTLTGHRHTLALPTSAHAVASLLAPRHGQQVEDVLTTIQETAAQLCSMEMELASLSRDGPVLAAAGGADKARAGGIGRSRPADIASAIASLQRAGAAAAEVISVYRGAGVMALDSAGGQAGMMPREDWGTEMLAGALREAFPGVEVQVLDGGQRGNGYLVTWE